MSLFVLPLELHVAILEYLSNQDGARLCQTCVRFDRMLKPYVYRVLKHRFERNQTLGNHSRYLWLIARTFLENCNLGPLVQEIVFTGEQWDDAHQRYKCPWHTMYPSSSDVYNPSNIRRCTCQESISLTPSEISMVETFLRDKLRVRDLVTWRAEVTARSANLLFTLLLALVPNLRSLRLSSGLSVNHTCLVYLFSLSMSPLCQHSLSNTSKRTKPLAKLKLIDLTLGFFDEEDNEGFDNIPTLAIQTLHLLFLPKIETLIIHPPLQLGDILPKSQRKAISSVRTLRMLKSNPALSILSDLIDCVSNLQNLEYECHALPPGWMIDDEDDPMYEQRLNMGKLQKDLERCSETLQSLKLAVSDFHIRVEGEPVSLREFDKLRHLEIPFVMFFGLNNRAEEDTERVWEVESQINGDLASVFPPSIEHLCLTDDVAWEEEFYYWDPRHWYKVVNTFMGYKSSHIQNLADLN